MDSYKNRERVSIELQGRTVEELKIELREHLSRALEKPKAELVLQSHRLPQSVGGLIPAKGELQGMLGFPYAGFLSDFVTYLDKESSVTFQITVVDASGSSRVSFPVTQGIVEHIEKVETKRNSFAYVKIINNGDVDVVAVGAFNYKERIDNANPEIRSIVNP